MQSINGLREDFFGSIIFCANINGCEKTAQMRTAYVRFSPGDPFYVPDNFMLISLTVSHFISK